MRMHMLVNQNKHAVGHAGNGQSALLQGAVGLVYHRPLVLFHIPLSISQHTHTHTINTNAPFIMFSFTRSFSAPAALIEAVTWAARFPWGKIGLPLFRRASTSMVGNGDGTAAVGESLKLTCESTKTPTVVDGEVGGVQQGESSFSSAMLDQDDALDQATTLDQTITLDQAASYSALGHNATLDQDDAFDQAITLDQTITHDQAASYSTLSHNATLEQDGAFDQAITLDLTTACDQAASYWEYKPINTASSLPVSSTGLITPPPSPVASATLPLATLPALDTLPALITLSACPVRRRKGVLGGPIPKPNVINEIPAGWPGLAASRWATPKQQQQPATASSSVPTTPATPTTTTVSATATPSPPRRRRKGVLGGPIPKPKVVNEIPAGCAGLAASRWATPKETGGEALAAAGVQASAVPAAGDAKELCVRQVVAAAAAGGGGR